MEKNYESVKLACQIWITYNLFTNKSNKYKRKLKHGPQTRGPGQRQTTYRPQVTFLKWSQVCFGRDRPSNWNMFLWYHHGHLLIIYMLEIKKNRNNNKQQKWMFSVSYYGDITGKRQFWKPINVTLS